MAHVEEIYNLALSHLGIAKSVDDAAALTPEALGLTRFWETALHKVLRDFPWPFATAFATPTLVEEDPTSEWDYSYRLPTDCLTVRRIVQDDSSRNETRQSRAPWRIVRDTDSTEWSAAITYAAGDYAKVTTGSERLWYRSLQGTNLNQAPATQTAYWVALAAGDAPPRLLLTDRVDAEIEYTALVDDIGEWPRDARMALSYYLAHLAAPRLTQDETGKSSVRPLGLYYTELSQAQANAGDEEQPDDPQPSEFERVRNQ